MKTPILALLLTASLAGSDQVYTDIQVAEIQKVIDGDTLDVAIRGYNERVRLLYVDTPETKSNPHGGRHTYGDVAASRLADLLPSGSRVILRTDSNTFKRDANGRLLALIMLKQGGSIQEHLIREGSSTYWMKYGRAEDWMHMKLVDAEKSAERSQLGLWSADKEYMIAKRAENDEGRGPRSRIDTRNLVPTEHPPSLTAAVEQPVAMQDFRPVSPARMGQQAIPVMPPLIAPNGDIRGADNDGDGRRETEFVRGYTKKDGTVVPGHYRAPRTPRK